MSHFYVAVLPYKIYLKLPAMAYFYFTFKYFYRVIFINPLFVFEQSPRRTKA